ncbi:ribonuclease Y [Patescibacteria group bacterium]|nr:ribonuclease Y [Patescibacteria group bacterium]
MEYILGLAGLVVGVGGGMYWQKTQVKSGANRLKEKAEKALADAKQERVEILIKAKESSLDIIDRAKNEEESRRKEVNALQLRLEKRESIFSQKLLELQDKQQVVYEKIDKIEKAKERIRQIKDEQVAKLEEIAKLPRDKAVELLLDKVKEENKENLMHRISKLDQETHEVLEEKARHLLMNTCQRIASSVTSEFTSTSVDLPNDEMKGRIIGKEGRNIRAIEKLTGVEILVDDTPNVITISGFSLIRRHIAKKALESLILDGRIQPAKIEEAIETAKRELAVDMKKAGETACYELGITGFDPKLVQIIGRLKYRTSYGQNGLLHSMQVGRVAGFLAEELGLDVTLAKKGGLLHDIGKTVDQEVTGTHPEIGGKIARKFNLVQEIIDPIETHHDDKPKGILSVIVKVADAISGGRPGARNDSFEKYLTRLGDLEKVANAFPGVERTYAIQAGREIRVFVTPQEIDDFKARELAKAIAHKIEQELQYPGEIKVNVIRELRVIEFAR